MPVTLSRLDRLLLLMTIIWGTNYALIKSAFREIDPQAFNALRLVLASIVMAAVSSFSSALISPAPMLQPKRAPSIDGVSV